MYGWLWHHLPGNRLLKALQALVLTAAVVAALFLVVFPAVSPHLPFNNVTVTSPAVTTDPGR
ncbi:MAG TPA: hypothetical protein VGD03_14255 [Frankiaceae bacterium]